MRAKLLLTLAAVMLTPIWVLAQAPVDGQDSLVDHMVGTWKLEGQVMGRDAHHEVHADWVLNHQFLRIQEKTSASAPDNESRYEAFWFLGYDRISERYVLHLIDVFGARYSEVIGYGIRDGTNIDFVFEYPDGPFHTTYSWNPKNDGWEWRMQQKDPSGKWTPFATLKLIRTPSP
jgi:hypothetical protein